MFTMLQMYNLKYMDSIEMEESAHFDLWHVFFIPLLKLFAGYALWFYS